jgi:hypothetical protein
MGLRYSDPNGFFFKFALLHYLYGKSPKNCSEGTFYDHLFKR